MILSSLADLGWRTNAGKKLFTKAMEYMLRKTFGHIIEHHSGDDGVRTLDCASLFQTMTFSQIAWRESLRDIETCLGANHAVFHMGTRICHPALRCPMT